VGSEPGEVVKRVKVLGIDVGTSSVRMVAFDSAAQPVRGLRWQKSYSPEATSDGGVTVKPEMLAELVFEGLDELNRLVADTEEPRFSAVGFSCFWHSLLALDAAGKPLTPVLLWADTRSEKVVSDLARRVDLTRLHTETGAMLHSSYWPAKIAWLASEDPSSFARCRRLVSFGEYLYQRLLGTWQVTTSMASGTGLFDVRTCEWSQYALSLLPQGVGAMLSPVGDGLLEGLSAELCKRWPSVAGTAWLPAIGDGACSNVGVAGVSPGWVVVTVGTSSAVRSIQSGRCGGKFGSLDDGQHLWCYRLDQEWSVIGGALSEGGNLIRWLKDTLSLDALEPLEAEITERAPDIARLTVLPFIAGERSPHWASNAKLTVHGVDLHTRPVDLLQAAMEAVTYQLGDVYEALGTSASSSGVIATGGALVRSPVWVQIIAGVFGREVFTSPVEESSSRGAAIMALNAVGAVHLEDLQPLLGPSYRPRWDPDLYLAARRRQQQLYTLIRGTVTPVEDAGKVSR